MESKRYIGYPLLCVERSCLAKVIDSIWNRIWHEAGSMFDFERDRFVKAIRDGIGDIVE